MHRTQIYLETEQYEKLKAQSSAAGVSISELIRRCIEKDLKHDPVANAEAFFEKLMPLESFKAIEPKAYTRALRSSSRMLRSRA